jgi:excisionase family DNA binding protein
MVSARYLAALLLGSFRLLYLGKPPQQKHPDRIDASELQARRVPLSLLFNPGPPRASPGKTKGRDTLNNSNEITAPNWSGRLDLNQRPLAPQSDSARSAGLASGGTGAQALDIIESVERADTSNGAAARPDQRGFVPPVSPRYVQLPEQLLTVREIAQRLRVCSATVYKLCAAGELVHVRISNAIRFSPSELAEFLARRRSR